MIIFSLGHGLYYWRNVLSERDVHHFHGVLPDDDSFISAVNCKLVEAVLFIFRVHLPMRRKKKSVEEAYKNAKDATFGWKIDSAFRGAVCVNLMHYFSFKVCCLELLYKLIKWFISFLDGPFCELVKEKLWHYRRYSSLCSWDAVRGDFPWLSYTCSSFPSNPCSAWISLLATSPYPFCCWTSSSCSCF